MDQQKVAIRYGGIGGKILAAFVLASSILSITLCSVFYRSMERDLLRQSELIGTLTVSYLARSSPVDFAMKQEDNLRQLIEGILEEAEQDAGAVWGSIMDQESSFSVVAHVKGYEDLHVPPRSLEETENLSRVRWTDPTGVVFIGYMARLHNLGKGFSAPSDSGIEASLYGWEKEQPSSQEQARKSSGVAMIVFTQKPMQERMRQNLYRWVGISAMAIFLSTLLGWALSKKISTPIQETAAIALKIADGKLDERAPVRSNDEVGLFSDAFNRMVDSVREQIHRSDEMSKNMQKAMERANILVESVAQAVQQLSGSTSSILTVSAEQASGATEQAASVQEANTTSEEIATMARMISDNANSMENTSEQMTDRCREGLKVIENAIEAMSLIRSQVNSLQENMMALNDNSQQVNEIVETINWFADQTNLVALNASIEAAGAGDAGIRFGAVANELRELARNINEQTKQIRERANQIQTSIASTVVATENGTQTVQHGTEVVQRVRESFLQIMELVTKTGDAIKHIHVSTKQQEGACSELASNISGIATVATQVAQNAEQTERSMGNLDQLTSQLRELLAEDQE